MQNITELVGQVRSTIKNISVKKKAYSIFKDLLATSKQMQNLSPYWLHQKDADLVNVPITQLARFADGVLIFGNQEIERLQNFTELVGGDRSTIKDNLVKKKAHLVFKDLSINNRTAFFLYALGTMIYKLGRRNSQFTWGQSRVGESIMR